MQITCGACKCNLGGEENQMQSLFNSPDEQGKLSLGFLRVPKEYLPGNNVFILF